MLPYCCCLLQFLTLDDMKEQKNIGIKNDSDDVEKVTNELYLTKKNIFLVGGDFTFYFVSI